MAEAMLDCALCSARKWHVMEPPSAEELRLAGATRLPCDICNSNTYWIFAQHDRRLNQDRRKSSAEAPLPQEVAVQAGGQRIAIKPPPDKEYFRQQAMELLQDRRSGVERRESFQRVSHRVPLNIPIRVRVSLPSLRFEEVTNTVNVCRGGVYFKTIRPYTKGTSAFVVLNYSALDPNKIEQMGTVVRVDTSPGIEQRGVAIHLS